MSSGLSKIHTSHLIAQQKRPSWAGDVLQHIIHLQQLVLDLTRAKLSLRSIQLPGILVLDEQTRLADVAKS